MVSSRAFPKKNAPTGVRLLRRCCGLAKDDRGFTAVEFALVAMPFLAFLFAILEVALVYFGTFTLENAVDQTARQIRTGQAHMSAMTRNQFKQQVCDNVATLTNCMAELKVDIRAFDNFSSMVPPDAFDGDGQFNPDGANSFDIGSGGDVVLVSVFYKWDLIGEIPGIGLQNQDDGSRLLTAVAAFRNEPFEIN